MNKKLPIVDALAEYFADSGVDHVFGFPGESTLPLYTAYKTREDITHIMAGCERCAGYMADVYSRLTRKIGVVDSPGGIGSPWLVPATSEAYNSSTPVLSVLSGVPTDKTEKWTTSECPQQELFRPITNKTLRLENPNRLFDFLRVLLSSATGSRMGPVTLEVPTDLMSEEIVYQENLHDFTYPSHRVVPADDALHLAMEKLRGSRNPVVMAGGGVHFSGAYDELKKFSEQFNIPVATSINGKGAVDEVSPLSIGVVGNKGTVAANDFFRTRDLAIVVGSKLGDKTTDQYRLFPSDMPIIHIDTNPEEIGRNFHPAAGLVGDARETLKAFLSFHLPARDDEETEREIRKTQHDRQNKYNHLELPHFPACPSFIIKEINRRYNGNAVICADASVSSGWAGALALSRGGRRNVITPRGSGSLGFGFPATLAAKVALPKMPVFGIGGDGGFAMSVHEIETACRLGLDVHYFVLNNGSLGLLESHLENSGVNNILDRRHPTDWEKIASGFGARGFTVHKNSDVEDYFDNLPVGPSIVQVMMNDSNFSAPDFESITHEL